MSAGIFAATLASTAALLSRAPFTAPLMERSAQEIGRAVDRAMAGTVTPGWLLPRLEAALAGGDADGVADYAALAERHGIPLSPDTMTAIAESRAAQDGMLATLSDCAACAYDMTRCTRPVLFAACALPFEMTPLGDVNALRRATEAYFGGGDVDALDAGLAALGLGATGAALITGGATLAVKAGATTLRLARRAGTLTPAFARTLRDTATLSRRDRLRDLVGDLGGLASRAGPGDTVRLLAHVETAQDARRLARLAAVTGPDTRRIVTALGPGRAMRLTLRLTRDAAAALLALYALALQIALWLAGRVSRALLRALI